MLRWTKNFTCFKISEKLDGFPTSTLVALSPKVQLEAKQKSLLFNSANSLAYTLTAWKLAILSLFCKQVLHHIDTQCDDGAQQYPNAAKAVEEAFRVLKPNGVLMIDMHSEEQAAHGYWFYSLIPKAAAKFKRKVIPEGMMFEQLKRAGNVLFSFKFSRLNSVNF